MEFNSGFKGLSVIPLRWPVWYTIVWGNNLWSIEPNSPAVGGAESVRSMEKGTKNSPACVLRGGRTAGANSRRAGSIGTVVEQSYWQITSNWLVKEFHFMGTATLLSSLQQLASRPIITVLPPTSVDSIIIFYQTLYDYNSFISSNLIHNSYINSTKLNASTCFGHHPPILRRSMSLTLKSPN